MSNTLSGTDKSVILLMTIGEDRAAEVFKHLSQREVQILSAAMANVRQISNKQLTEVLSEFEQEAEQFAALNVNANDYLRSVLVKALGEETSASIERLGAAAKALSSTSLFAPTEIASGLRILAQAGLTANEALVSIPHVLDLATTGEMQMADAATTLVGVMPRWTSTRG